MPLITNVVAARSAEWNHFGVSELGHRRMIGSIFGFTVYHFAISAFARAIITMTTIHLDSLKSDSNCNIIVNFQLLPFDRVYSIVVTC